jgi:hypothetical protein
VISNATNIYGISMHDGISKIVSLKIWYHHADSSQTSVLVVCTTGLVR